MYTMHFCWLNPHYESIVITENMDFIADFRGVGEAAADAN